MSDTLNPNPESKRWENVVGKAVKDWTTAIMASRGVTREDARQVVLGFIREVTEELTAATTDSMTFPPKSCPWCELEYELTPDTEREHLKICQVFQTLPVAETSPEGKTFVALPNFPDILVERVRIQ